MSSLGALSRRKGLKRGVLYVFCTFLPAFWSSQFPTSDSSAGRFLSAGSVFLSPRCGFGGGGGRKQEKFHLGGIVKAGEAASDRWGGLHQERLAKAAQAGGGLHHPKQGGFGDWEVFVVFSISMVLAWTVTQASSSASSCLGLAHL